MYKMLKEVPNKYKKNSEKIIKKFVKCLNISLNDISSTYYNNYIMEKDEKEDKDMDLNQQTIDFFLPYMIMYQQKMLEHI